ncbi:hypothetical protein GWI33_002020 [Rhynchophorus ferrugineus]|uniref:Uncharacterized protein n=1 Tax=Rhynchophorus ferrugineus TaxID=354439 RepID=A0A834IU14_RHYFE|nr:hypothetical protein GWI33_002020 [Rhynchophorus ferrugineus]
MLILHIQEILPTNSKRDLLDIIHNRDTYKIIKIQLPAKFAIYTIHGGDTTAPLTCVIRNVEKTTGVRCFTSVRPILFSVPSFVLSAVEVSDTFSV